MEAVKNNLHVLTEEEVALISKLQNAVKSEGGFAFKNIDDKGNPLREWENLKLLIEHHNIKVVLNSISKQVEIQGLETNDFESCVCDIHSLCAKNDFKMPVDSIERFVKRISVANEYNPVTNYLMEAYNDWDKQPGRIQKACDSLITDITFSRFFKEKLIKKWLVNAVMIPFNDGEMNTEGVLILQGAQGKGKTTWIKSLIPVELKTYFKEGMRLIVSDKDSVYESVSNWIVELGELDGTLKKDQAGLKAFFNRQLDVQRRPYDRTTTTFPRRTAFFGTVNKDEFLKDETGDRRYWVIPIVEIKRDFLPKDEIKHFWGEVMHIWKSGEMPHYLDAMELEVLNESNSSYRETTPTEINIENGFDWSVSESEWTYKKAAEIRATLNIKTPKGFRAALEKYGAKYSRNNSGAIYLTPPYRNDIPLL